MMRKIALAALILVSLSSAAVAKPAPKAAATPKAAAARARAAAPSASFDSGDPANLVAILNQAGAKAQIAKRDGDAVLVSVTSTAANFSAQFADCDAVGKGCKAVVFDSLAEGAPSMVQINGFNQASALCRGYMDKLGKAHVVYSALLFRDETRPHFSTTLVAWQNCIGNFTAFARNPVAYLAAAP